MTEQANSLVTIDYTNWRGERRERQVIVHRMIFGSNEWHPEPQWLLLAMDPEDKKEKTFAMSNIHSWNRRSPSPAVEGGWRDVLAERERQKTVEGWTDKRDDNYTAGQLAKAAACYALSAGCWMVNIDNLLSIIWPWHSKWWKPTTPRRDLVKAGALILAEIERLDRAALPTPPAGEKMG